MEKIKLEKTKPMKLAYIEHVGDYGEILFNDYISRLYAWAKENKVRPGFTSIGIYLDNPHYDSSSEGCFHHHFSKKGDAPLLLFYVS